jgi:hypothetical protein
VVRSVGLGIAKPTALKAPSGPTARRDAGCVGFASGQPRNGALRGGNRPTGLGPIMRVHAALPSARVAMGGKVAADRAGGKRIVVWGRAAEPPYSISTWCAKATPSVIVTCLKPSSFSRSKKVASSAMVFSWKKGVTRDAAVIIAKKARAR